MNQEIFKDILNNDQICSTLPDALVQHWPLPDYIRFLVTRSRVLNGDISREDIVRKCGISLSSLNKYVTRSSNQSTSCPYSVQFLLERLAKLGCSDRASVFELKMVVPKEDVEFFSQFDNFMASDMMTGLMGTSVVISTVLTEEEVFKLREKGVEVRAVFEGN